MLYVGLTGGLGSGKSTVAAIFQSLGVRVISADDIGRDLMQPGHAVYDAIVRQFGQAVLLPANSAAQRPLNRPALAAIAFDQGRVEELNAIVHPAVIAAQEQRMRQIAEREPDAIVMVESALIFETIHGEIPSEAPPHGDAEDREIAAAITTTGWKRFDRLVLVTAREEVKIARYLLRVAAGRALSPAERGTLQDDARRRLALMISDEVKSPLCDYVIDNNGDRAALDAAVRRAYAALRGSAAALARAGSRLTP
jgi:dephospho-CoA kinase